MKFSLIDPFNHKLLYLGQNWWTRSARISWYQRSKGGYRAKMVTLSTIRQLRSATAAIIFFTTNDLIYQDLLSAATTNLSKFVLPKLIEHFYFKP